MEKITIPELILVAGTRVMLGAGIGMLLAGRMSRDQSKAAGIALALVGALTTVPLMMEVKGKRFGERAESLRAV